jgi:hypothetical protein
MSDFIEAPHSELSNKGDAFKVGHLVDHRFYRNLHGRGLSLFQFCRLIALGSRAS